jgi:LmbE family N-acetylglucosaminyl deacetylase
MPSAARNHYVHFQPERVMILAPHTDDGEFGCGGTIARLLEEGSEVFYTAFSVCEQSVPHGFKQDELERELMAATYTLGIPEKNVIVRRYPVRRFPDFRQDILQDILEVKKEVNPELIFMPCMEDIHQDHQVIAAEGVRAYKNHSIVCYEMPWNNLTISTSSFVVLEERHVQKKLAALSCYKTQTFRQYANEEFIRALARTRGAQIGQRYAEVFQLLRLVI